MRSTLSRSSTHSYGSCKVHQEVCTAPLVQMRGLVRTGIHSASAAGTFGTGVPGRTGTCVASRLLHCEGILTVISRRHAWVKRKHARFHRSELDTVKPGLRTRTLTYSTTRLRVPGRESSKVFSVLTQSPYHQAARYLDLMYLGVPQGT